MMTSGVATPRVASNNIAVVITIAATNPASNPARIAFALLITVSISCGGACAKRLLAFGERRLQQFHFAAARIFRARSTTISDVTCFMQA